jgi:hypothetical protein
VPGDYPESALPSSGWMESRYGTYQFPILIQSADGPGTTRLHGYLNIFDTRYLYLSGLDFVTDLNYGGGSNVVHIEQGDHILIRNSKLDGFDGSVSQPQETLKVNQSRYIYIEDSDISGAFWFALDFVGVQNGHIQGNRLHRTDNDCVVLKGGSAYLRIEGNRIYDCGNIGFSAGQGTGFEFMVSPWLHYEAYDMKFINNLVYDVQNAGMAVRGGYNILLANNTLYTVGIASGGAALLLVAPGSRSCDGDSAACQSRNSAGGWGPASQSEGGEWIPNRNVFVYNNIFYNPAPVQTVYSHLSVFGAVSPPAGTTIPNPAQSDTNLKIQGNLIWNGPTDHPLGVEESDQGCQPTNPTCNQTQLLRDNAINTIEPQLVDPSSNDFHPVAGGNIFGVSPFSISDFLGGDRPTTPLAPVGNLTNSVIWDFDGQTRTVPGLIGAYAYSTSNSPHEEAALMVWAISSGQIELSWHAFGSQVSGYIIERSLNGTSGWVQTGSEVGSGIGRLVDSGLDPATEYFYRVKTLPIGGLSSYSNLATATTTLIKVSQSSDNGQGNVTESLSWAFGQSAPGRTIYFALSPANTIEVTGALPRIPAGSKQAGVTRMITLLGACGSSSVVLKGKDLPSNTSGLLLGGFDNLIGLTVGNFPGVQVQSILGKTNNHFQCMIIKKTM